MRRRDFIKGVGASAAWPLIARAQQSTMPVIGFLGSSSADPYVNRLRYFRQGLSKTGFIEGQNVAIDYRWAEEQYDRLPALATLLVQHQVAVIVAAGGTPSALATKAATATIPIIFAVGIDPVAAGLVSSLNRPGGNITGVTNLNLEVGPKRLELMRELLPSITVIAVLVNPTNPVITESVVRSLQAPASRFGLKLHVLSASTERDIDKAFTAVAQLGAGALIVGTDNFFNSQSEHIATLSMRHAIPTIFQYRPFVAAGGLLSYGSDETEYYRLVGVYAGRILKGEKPADLPVQRSTKVELIINLKTAKTLGLTVPMSLLGRADEVIE
jgi:putative tryptophan/tyrosine transport system substrate-binding protein